MAHEPPPSQPSAPLPAVVAVIKPFVSVTVCRLVGEKPDVALEAALGEIQRRATAASGSETTGWRRSSVTPLGTLRVVSLEWCEERAASSFADGRKDRTHRFALVATNGTYLGLTTNSPTSARRFLKWARSPKQGFVRPLSERSMRAVAAGQTAVAAWLRNTMPGRSTQFTALAVAGTNVADGALAADLSAYLASTVRVERATGDTGSEDVTVNPSFCKLTLRRSDKIESWAELVECTFAWIVVAEGAAPRPMLKGTAEVLDSLEGIGAPYEVLLTVTIPELMIDEIEERVEPSSPIRFEVEKGGDPKQFSSNVYHGADYVGRAKFGLVQQDDHFDYRFDLTDVARTDLAPVAREAVSDFGVEVHYTTEHLFSHGVISHRPIHPAPFRSYDWIDFKAVDIDITKEKPSDAAAEMRRLIGTEMDDSLFGWEVRTCTKGWLVCDDGANETADFIQLTDEDIVLKAFKSAKAGGLSRSTGAIQEVQAQATKNIGFLDDITLLHKALSARRKGLVVFKDGLRQSDPDEFLTELAAVQPALIRRAVVIVQPQLEYNAVTAAHVRIAAGSRKPADLGMMRVDALLRALDGECAKRGIGFNVIGRR